MGRRPVHPLLKAVRAALPRAASPAARSYLSLLNRRLAALAAVTAGGVRGRGWTGTPAERNLAQRFLKPFEGEWDDGDENLVRGYLDRWTGPREDPLRAAARGLTEAARALAEMQARPGTLWFFLWEMESILSGLGPQPRRAPECALERGGPSRSRRWSRRSRHRC